MEKTEKIKNSLYVKCYCAIEGILAYVWILLTRMGYSKCPFKLA